MSSEILMSSDVSCSTIESKVFNATVESENKSEVKTIPYKRCQKTKF